MASSISKSQNPFGVSFIQTQAGATITGEIKRYLTYQDMVEDPAPTRLASVANASRDEDYAVPEEYVGGILYQRDFINSTWILLYTDKDLAVPTYVDWSHILNVPPWVGGVSNNRVKLTQDTYANTRTTYYSYGPYKLMLPPPELVPLGDEIVLEQYDNYGFVLFQQDERIQLTGREVTVTDTTTTPSTTYFVTYTYPEFEYVINEDNGNRTVVGEKPISCNTFRFIRTETDNGIPFWTLETDGDNLDRAVYQMGERIAAHEKAKNPHNMYILKDEAEQYLSVSVKQATSARLGTVRLSTYDDLGRASVGAIAVTPSDLYAYLYNNYALKTHTHQQYALVDHTHSQYAVLVHKHVIDDVDGLRNELANKAPLNHTHEISDVNGLSTELANKQDLLASEGRYIEVDGKTVNCTVPDASTEEKGLATLVAAVTDENKDSETLALTPASLDSIKEIIGRLTGNILGRTDKRNLLYTNNSDTRGFVFLPFTYTAKSAAKEKTYRVALAWCSTDRVKTLKANSYDVDIRVDGFCKFDKLLFPILNVEAADLDQTQLERSNMTLQYQGVLRNKPIFDSNGNPTDSAITHLKLVLNRINSGLSAGDVTIHWAVFGLVSVDDLWESLSFYDINFRGINANHIEVVATDNATADTSLNALKGASNRALLLMQYSKVSISADFLVPDQSVYRSAQLTGDQDPTTTMAETWVYKRHPNDTVEVDANAKYNFLNNVIHVMSRHSRGVSCETYLRLGNSNITISGTGMTITDVHSVTTTTSNPNATLEYPSATTVQNIPMGGFRITQDTRRVNGKVYFTRDANDPNKYHIVNEGDPNTVSPTGKGWYELYGGKVIASCDIRNDNDRIHVRIIATYSDNEIRFTAFSEAYGEENNYAAVQMIASMPDPTFVNT